MAMIINTNVMAINAQRNLSVTSGKLGKALEQLSSGSRINRSADDAAGLAISEKMRSLIRGLHQGARNGQDGISMIQTAEGALSEVHNILQRMRELSVQAGNSTLSASDRTAIGEETSPDIFKFELQTCGLRDQGDAIGSPATQLWVWPAAQWWLEIDRKAADPQPVPATQPPLLRARTRCSVECDGRPQDALPLQHASIGPWDVAARSWTSTSAARWCCRACA